MTRSHRNEDRGGEHRWTFNGVEYPTRKLMCEARRAEYVRLLDEEGMNFTQAAHAVGVSKRTGKAWRNGRTRATGRNEKPLVDWYRSTMDKPKTLHPRYLSQEERIQIADRLRLGCLCSISCCGFSHDDFSGLGRACRPRNGLNWMVLVSPPERTGKDYDQHAPSTVYPSFAAERGIRRVDRAENTCQRADGA